MIRSRIAGLFQGGKTAGVVLAALLLAQALPAPAAETSVAPVAEKPSSAKDDGKTTPAADGKTNSAKDVPAAGASFPANDKSGKAEGPADTPAPAADKANKKATTLPKARMIGKFDSWEAAYFDDHGNKVCYMATSPASTSSSAPVHGRDKNVMLFITHWPADNEKNAVTIAAGYSYKEGTKAIVNIGTESYALETGGPGTGADADMSWMKDDSQDDALTNAIQKGDELTVRGTSKRGTTITDTYSLKGSADAYKAITKTCGY